MAAPIFKDRVKETTRTTGTGMLTLDGAVTKFQSFAAVGDGNECFYTIVEQHGTDWEVGRGTYTASGTTLSRDTVLASSNSGSAVSFAAGTKDVFLDVPADSIAPYDASTGSLGPITSLALGSIAPITDASASVSTFLRGDGTWAAISSTLTASGSAGQVAIFNSGTDLVGNSALAPASSLFVGTTPFEISEPSPGELQLGDGSSLKLDTNAATLFVPFVVSGFSGLDLSIKVDANRALTLLGGSSAAVTLTPAGTDEIDMMLGDGTTGYYMTPAMLQPVTDNGMDIGSAAHPWRSGYFGTFVDALAYKVGGVAGLPTFSGAVTNITVVNGIVTAAS